MEHRTEVGISNTSVKEMSWEEFLVIEQANESYLEYDGKNVTAISNPSRQHQRLSVRLSSLIDAIFRWF